MVDAGHRRPALILAVAAVIAAGLAVRFVPLGLPAGVVKYAGSTLWGAMVYGLIAAVRPAAAVRRLTVAALSVSAAVEFFRLVHTPWLDAFRLTLAGQLLLGRVFSPWNLLAYAVGIAVAAGCDAASRR
ncbi:hypothetical protein ASG52_09540 [Methylobacterium sp. Leaf456]|uniref:ribosomal maturation YjgA family protein n=1 Tax=Methylobacterium sp. Leaf456 TaxID=1736382 RepID=UPI0006F4AF92|nr:DUF2809 domain-containing protein [Methylobacterium sp. Leaf456]KQT49200.1 hypothetical protein ASG52_09540 [Methylobacterium sp. Leaf456]